jgi:hypothetical protein
MANGVPIPESKIFKLRDPADNDENDWATFDLRNVEVVNKKGKLVNLLHADLEHPFTVTGTLQALQKGNSHLCEFKHTSFARPHSYPALLMHFYSTTIRTDETQKRYNSSQERCTFCIWSLRKWRC